jgi:rhodanese-related sulfurtransferase
MAISYSLENILSFIGSDKAPVLIDVRIDEDYAANPRLIPASIRKNYAQVQEWAQDLDKSHPLCIICHKGLKLSEGVAAHLRVLGFNAKSLNSGIVGWQAAGYPLISPEKLPALSMPWVTRERPKIDRIACPWLITRFINPKATFLYVEASQVQAVGEKFNATPYDIDPCFFGHRGELTTFDTLLIESGLAGFAPLERLATIVRGADTDRLELAPQAAGLLAISLGLSKLYEDDLAQLKAGMLIYDALFAWLRFATNETHNWVSPKS